MHMHIVGHFLFGEMRESCAIIRADSVYAAHIGRQVEELAWLLPVHPVLIFFIEEQPFLFKLLRRHIEMRRYTPDIFSIKSRAHGFAAIGAAKAICFLPYFRVHFFG